MSTNDKIQIDKYRSGEAPDMAKFNVGATTLAEVQESLRRRDALRNEQNAAVERGSGPVRRD